MSNQYFEIALPQVTTDKQEADAALLLYREAIYELQARIKELEERITQLEP